MSSYTQRRKGLFARWGTKSCTRISWEGGRLGYGEIRLITGSSEAQIINAKYFSCDKTKMM